MHRERCIRDDDGTIIESFYSLHLHIRKLHYLFIIVIIIIIRLPSSQNEVISFESLSCMHIQGVLPGLIRSTRIPCKGR